MKHNPGTVLQYNPGVFYVADYDGTWVGFYSGNPGVTTELQEHIVSGEIAFNGFEDAIDEPAIGSVIRRHFGQYTNLWFRTQDGWIRDGNSRLTFSWEEIQKDKMEVLFTP